MKNTMKLFAVATIAMVVAVIVIIMNAVSMDKKVANAYVKDVSYPQLRELKLLEVQIGIIIACILPATAGIRF